jgi:hypothetical protein
MSEVTLFTPNTKRGCIVIIIIIIIIDVLFITLACNPHGMV